MARFDGLIDELAGDLAPRRPTSLWAGWLAVVLGLGVLSAGFLAIRPLRADLVQESLPAITVWRLAASLGVGLAAATIALAAAAPQFRARFGHVAALGASLALFLLPGLAAWLADDMPNPMLPGWSLCLRMTFLMGLGHLGLMLLWLRRGAPAEPAQAGALAGLAAGGFAGFSYALHCLHDVAWYALVWYSVSTLALMGLGALLGRRFCRW